MILSGGAIQAFGLRDEVIPLITGRKPNGPVDGPPTVTP
jgi:ATP-binding cassette subfamily C protein